EGVHLDNIALGSFTDTNPNATADDFTGVINWGDGSPPDVATFTRVGVQGGNSLWLVTGNHTFAHAAGAPFSVSVDITDKDTPGTTLTLSTTAPVVQTPLAVMVPALTPPVAGAVPAGKAIGTFRANAV